jgi:beta-fructofuranosidase
MLFRVDDDLAGYAFDFDRGRASVSLIKWPQPVEEIWWAVAGTTESFQSIDGARLVEHFQIDLSESADVVVTVVVGESLIELFLNDQIAITYRIYDASTHELGIFVPDGNLTCREMHLATRGERGPPGGGPNLAHSAAKPDSSPPRPSA